MAKVKRLVNKMKVRQWVALASIAGFAVLLAGVGVLRAAPSDSTAKEYVAKVLADYVGESKDAGVASGLASWLLGTDAEFGATMLSDKSAAGNFSRVAMCDSDTPADACVEHGREYFSLGVASSTVISWRNMLGRTIWVERVWGQVNGSASTTLMFTMGTSTVSGVTLDATGYNFSTTTISATGAAPPENRSILNEVIATSTQPYISNAGGNNPSYRTNAYGNVQTTSTDSGLVPVRNGEYVLGFIRTLDPQWAVTTTIGRGIGSDPYVVIDYIFANTSTSR